MFSYIDAENLGDDWYSTGWSDAFCGLLYNEDGILEGDEEFEFLYRAGYEDCKESIR